MLPTSLLYLLAAALPLCFSAPISIPSKIDTLPLPASPLYTGSATLFTPGLGACGHTDTQADYVVSLPSSAFRSGENCDLYLQIENTGNGKRAYARARDECTTCVGEGLDLSQALFDLLSGGGESEGELEIEWSFMPEEWSPVLGMLPELAAEVNSSST